MSGSVFPTPTLQWGVLQQDPTSAMQLATKEYVDAKVGGIPEAPTDGQTYGRDGQTATWNAITLAPVASSTAPLMDGTASAGVATAWSRGDHVHPTDTSRYAASNPSGYVNAAGAATAAPVQSVATRTGAITLTHTDITDWASTLAPYALLASPTFTGTPSLPTGTTGITQTAGTNNTTLATTAFVQGAVAVPASAAPLMDGTAAVGTSLLYARQDHVHPTDTSRAPLGSPALTGTPTAPTATAGTSTTQLATTAFVQAAIPAVAPATVAPLMDSLAAVGTSLLYARQDHVHPTDTSRAPLASPGLTGAPTSVTPATADNSTAIATTAFVKAQGYGVPPSPATVAPVMDGSAVVGTSTLYARQDHVHPTDTSRAPIASPTFTGTVTIPAGAAIAGYAPLASPTFTGALTLANGNLLAQNGEFWSYSGSSGEWPGLVMVDQTTNHTWYSAVDSGGIYRLYDSTDAWYPMSVAPGNPGTISFNGPITSVSPVTVTDLTLSDSTAPLLTFNTAGAGPPTFTTRSGGTKIALYPNESATAVDYAIGINSFTLWNSVPQATSSFFFSWYAGQTQVATLNGVGNLTVADLTLNDAAAPLILYPGVGSGQPTFTTRSAGTKIVLLPALSGTAVDYAIGYGGGILWTSVPTSASTFAWYAGTTSIATMNGAGSMSVTGALGAATHISIGGNQVVGARITGYGTPTGGATVSSFPGATATLAQTSAQLAQLILDLKTHGLLGT